MIGCQDTCRLAASYCASSTSTCEQPRAAAVCTTRSREPPPLPDTPLPDNLSAAPARLLILPPFPCYLHSHPPPLASTKALDPTSNECFAPPSPDQSCRDGFLWRTRSYLRAWDRGIAVVVPASATQASLSAPRPAAEASGRLGPGVELLETAVGVANECLPSVSLTPG